MRRDRTLFLLAASSLLSCGMGTAPPTCSDGTAAANYDVYSPPVACLEYQDMSCCSNRARSKASLRAIYTYETKYKDCPSCMRNMRALQCGMKCNPFNSRYVRKDADHATTGKGTLTLCAGFCRDLHHSCGNCSAGYNPGGRAGVQKTIQEAFPDPIKWCERADAWLYEWGQLSVQVTSPSSESKLCFHTAGDPEKIGVKTENGEGYRCQNCSDCFTNGVKPCCYESGEGALAARVDRIVKPVKPTFFVLEVLVAMFIFYLLMMFVGMKMRADWRSSLGLAPYAFKEYTVAGCCGCETEDPDIL